MPTQILSLLLLTAFFGARIYGQGPKPSNKTYVLKAAALFDGKNNTLVTPDLVIVSAGHIVAVGPNATIPVAARSALPAASFLSLTTSTLFFVMKEGVIYKNEKSPAPPQETHP